jgi:hypothetical protein
VSSANPIRIPPELQRTRAALRSVQRALPGRFITLWRLARQIFHVLVGITFFVFAVAGAILSMREWRAYAQAPSAGVWRFATISGFTLLLVIFGLYSLLKARSVR